MIPTETWTSLKLIAWTQEYLANKGVDNARREAEWLLCAATGLDRVGLYLNFEKPLNPDELAAYRSMVVRRGKREPLQHLLGTQEFAGLDFEVTPAVLIPRHDTETVLEEALTRGTDAKCLLDIGTGSGCLAITLALRLPAAAVTAVDISASALVVARRNAERLGAPVEFLEGSLFEPVHGRTFDLIISNPPYIPTAEIEQLQPEVRDYDPRLALDGGLDGLNFYATLIPQAINYLNSGSWLLLEIGAGQEADVQRLFAQTGRYAAAVTACDHAGIIRVVGARKL